MQNAPNRWKVFDPGMPILTCEYSFGPGTANALAVRGEAGLVVVSPPCRVGADVADQLASYGPVRALVAPNAFHHMGLASWRQRFPEAQVFAPAQSIPRLQHKTGWSDIRPLAEAAPITGAGLELIDMPHYKTGEALVRIHSERGLVWYVTDVIMNLPCLPAHPVAKLAFKLSRSAPGLKFNNIAPLFMVQNKAALKRWLAQQAAEAPPRWLVPSHGDVIELGSQPEVLSRLFVSS